MPRNYMCPSERSDETHYCMLRINFRAHASSFVCVSLSFSSLGLVCMFLFVKFHELVAAVRLRRDVSAFFRLPETRLVVSSLRLG